MRQSDNWSCGPTCIEAITGWRPKIGKPVKGTNGAQIVAALRRKGYPVTEGDGWNIDDLKHLTSTGRYVICSTRYRVEYGHWVVVWKVSGRWVYLHDPMDGPRRLSHRGLLDIWSFENWERYGIAVTALSPE